MHTGNLLSLRRGIGMSPGIVWGDVLRLVAAGVRDAAGQHSEDGMEVMISLEANRQDEPTADVF
jgi:hypothetical protein